jgi:hypothetical protein
MTGPPDKFARPGFWILRGYVQKRFKMTFAAVVIGGLLLIGLGIARVKGTRGTRDRVQTLFDRKSDGR